MVGGRRLRLPQFTIVIRELELELDVTGGSGSLQGQAFISATPVEKAKQTDRQKKKKKQYLAH